MSIVSNSINYATPNYSGIIEENFADSAKYFSLHDNILDGSYTLLGATTPLWSSILSDNTGILTPTVEITIEDTMTIHCLSIIGDVTAAVYPVTFDYFIYKAGTQLFGGTIYDNATTNFLYKLPTVYEADKIVIRVLKINKPYYTLRLTSLFNPHIVYRKGSVVTKLLNATKLSLLIPKHSSSAISVGLNANISSVIATLDVSNSVSIKLANPTKNDLTVVSKRVDNMTLQANTQNALTNTFKRVSSTGIKVNNAVSKFSNIFDRADSTSIKLNSSITRPTMYSKRQNSITNKLNSSISRLKVSAKKVDYITIQPTTVNKLYNDFYRSADMTISINNSVSKVTNKHKATDNATLRLNAARAKITNRFKRNNSIIVRLDGSSLPTNIHTVMKEATRTIYGKVLVTYMSPLVDEKLAITSNGIAYNSNVNQLYNASLDSSFIVTRLNNFKLDSSSYLMGDNTEVGWWSSFLSKTDGTFTTDPTLHMAFIPRLVMSLSIVSSAVHDIILVDYTVQVTSNGVVLTYEVTANTNFDNLIASVIPEVSAIDVIVHKINKANTPANIVEITTASTVTYEHENLISIDLLEELSYNDEVESLGGISANDVHINIDNTDKQFYFNNSESLIAKQLKKNRRIIPYLGAEVVPGQIEWHKLGTYWSYSWDVPVGNLYARVVAFDTLGLLKTFDFYKHQVYINYSLGTLIEFVLMDAKLTYTLLEWIIDSSLYSVIIPYAWFERNNHMAALEKIAQCYRLNIYCDRDGKIVAVPRYAIGSSYDEWSDSTNIINKSYPTLYTDVSNTINVYVTSIQVTNGPVLNFTSIIPIDGEYELTLASSYPIISNVSVTIGKDAGVSYSYEKYSWGVVFKFTGLGNVNSIMVSADYVLAKKDSIATSSNKELVQMDGVKVLTIDSPFIQTFDHALSLADSILQDAAVDIYDADVEYRGDISLTVNDPIILNNGIAPTKNYFIKRHELLWDGSLNGRAKINT
jgi:hypothetical protein